MPPLSPELKAKLDIYDILLQKWQQTINLVGASTLRESEVRHFQDSLQLLEYIPEGARTLYDLGSGAGFPGLVLAIARPDISVHLIESDQRKGTFLQTVSRETKTPVKVHTDRVERVPLPAPDVITARALADLSELLHMSERWWTSWPGLTMIFPKGIAAKAELEKARQTYQFQAAIHPSKTDKDASVLILTDIKKCE